MRMARARIRLAAAGARRQRKYRSVAAEAGDRGSRCGARHADAIDEAARAGVRPKTKDSRHAGERIRKRSPRSARAADGFGARSAPKARAALGMIAMPAHTTACSRHRLPRGDHPASAQKSSGRRPRCVRRMDRAGCAPRSEGTVLSTDAKCSRPMIQSPFGAPVARDERARLRGSGGRQTRIRWGRHALNASTDECPSWVRTCANGRPENPGLGRSDTRYRGGARVSVLGIATVHPS